MLAGAAKRSATEVWERQATDEGSVAQMLGQQGCLDLLRAGHGVGVVQFAQDQAVIVVLAAAGSAAGDATLLMVRLGAGM